MILALFSRVKLWAIGFVAILGAFAGVYAKGRGDAKAKADGIRKDEALKTHGDISNARIETKPDDARAWLDAHSKRGKLRDDRKP